MTLNIIAIILAVVALIVTGIGFFASLRFYREGMNLQSQANDALTKIAEKADSIHSQVGGMFNKTLDAALRRSHQLESDFEGINEQLENTANTIVDSALKQIRTADEDETKHLSSVVNEEIGLIRERVQETRESAEHFAELRMSAYDEAYKRFTKELSYAIGRYNGYSSNLAPESDKYTEVGVLERMNEVKAAELQLLSLCGKHVRSILSEAGTEWLNDVHSFGKIAPSIEQKLKETAFKDRTQENRNP